MLFYFTINCIVFVMNYDKEKTIVALATPPGQGSIAVIRISGKDTLERARPMIRKKKFTSHQAVLTSILDKDGNTIDKALVLPLLGNTSFTGEDTLEIQCHGGSLIPQKIIERALECGIEPAQPGEFSFKAFMNGKLSLSQAEAVQTLIAAKSEAGVKAANLQLEGRLHKKVTEFQTALFDIAAILEAWVDFPEEGLEFASFESVLGQLRFIRSNIEHLIATYSDGKRLTESHTLCLIGEPNVGKSSLLNALTGSARAIVTHIAGTTRDTLEQEITINGFAFTLIDTAGIRETDEVVEQEGVRRSHKAAEAADLILFVLDRSKGMTDDARTLLTKLPKDKTLIIWNKADIPDRNDETLAYDSLHVSAKTELGIDALKQAIVHTVDGAGKGNKEEILLTSARHHNALQEASDHLLSVIHGLESDVSAEFVTSDMRASLQALGSIIGTDVTEEILTSIFQKFCVGK